VSRRHDAFLVHFPTHSIPRAYTHTPITTVARGTEDQHSEFRLILLRWHAGFNKSQFDISHHPRA
jgi:hypothetical protein